MVPSSRYQRSSSAAMRAQFSSASDVEEVGRTKDVIGFKLYPLGATTNAQSGVGDLHEIVDLYAIFDDCVFDRAAIDRGVAADGNVLADTHAAKLGNGMQATSAVRRKSEPISTEYRTGMYNAARVHGDVGIEDGVGSDFHIVTDRAALADADARMQPHAGADATAGADDNMRSDTGRRIHQRIRRDYRWAGAGPPRLYYNGYNCSDGQIVLGCLTKATRNGARRVLGMEHDRTDEEGFDPWDAENIKQVHEWKAQVQATIRAHTVAYWVEKFSAEGVPVAPVQIPEELSEDEHVKALGVMVDMEHPVTGAQSVVGPITRMSLTPTRAQGPSPALGEHSAETLAKGGLSDAEIAKLRDAGVILQRD